MKHYAKLIAFIAATGFVACGDAPVEKLNSFTPNRTPTITSFTSDSPGGNILAPNQQYTINVVAEDLDEQELTFAYKANLGSFGNQTDTSNTSTVTFLLPGTLTGGFKAIVTLTVSDPKGAAVTQTLDLGSSKLGPTLSQQGGVIQATRSNGNTTISWAADSNGFYQIQVYDVPTTPCSSNLSQAFFFYSAGTQVNTNIYGSGSASTPKLSGPANSTDKVCIIVLDGLQQEGHLEYVIGEDETAPTSTASPAAGNYATPQNVSLTCDDSTFGNICDKIAYTMSTTGTPPGDPTIDGTGTITNGTLYTGPIAAINGVQTIIKYIASDAVFNVESPVNQVSYQVDSGTPTVTLVSNQYDYINTSGPPQNATDITWNANRANTAYSIRTDATCQTGGAAELASGTTPPTIGTNVITSVTAASLSAGANTIRVCVANVGATLWGFQTQGVTVDSTAPSGTPSPASATGISNTSTPIVITFTESMDTATLSIGGAMAAEDDGGVWSTAVNPNDVLTISPATNWTNVSSTSLSIDANDLAGNVLSTINLTYAIDDNIPVVNVTNNTAAIVNNAVASTITSTDITWTSSRSGLNFEVQVNDSCGGGAPLLTGVTPPGAATTVNASSLQHGANTIRFCVLNWVGTYGEATQAVQRIDEGPQYAAARNWNEYVERATTTNVCPLNPAGGYNNCIHGGESRYVMVPGYAGCASLTASDSLNVFNWRCVAGTNGVTDPARMVSAGMRRTGYLGNMLDFGTDTWRNNSISVFDGGPALFTTPATKWYANNVVTSTGGTISTASSIVLVKGDITTGIDIAVDEVGVVVQPGIAPIRNTGSSSACNGPPGTNSCIIRAVLRKKLWIEGQFSGSSVGKGILFEDTTYSVIRNVGVQSINDGGQGVGIQLFGAGGPPNGSSNNRLENIIVSNSANTGVYVYDSSFNTLLNVRGTNNGTVATNSGIALAADSHDNTLINTISMGSGGKGLNLQLANQGNNLVINSTVANNNDNNLNVQGGGSTFHNVFMNVAAMNSNVEGVYLNGADRSTYINLASSNDNNQHVRFSGSTYNYFSGLLKVGSNGCAGGGGTSGLDGTCDNTVLSNASLTLGAVVDLLGSFALQIGTDDTVNTSDSFGGAPAGSIADWLGFDNDMRGWGEDLAPFQGPCTSPVNCRIFDYTAKSADMLIHNVNAIPTGNAVYLRYWNPGDCSSIPGADSVTSVCDYPGAYTSGDCTGSIPGTWAPLCHTVGLRNAYEVIWDGIGNENGICESNETCIYTPNIGRYQGEDTLGAISFSGGTITGVTLLQYTSNGQ